MQESPAVQEPQQQEDSPAAAAELPLDAPQETDAGSDAAGQPAEDESTPSAGAQDDPMAPQPDQESDASPHEPTEEEQTNPAVDESVLQRQYQELQQLAADIIANPDNPYDSYRE